MNQEDKFLKIAKEAALEAGKVISQYIGQKHQCQTKNGDQSDFATQADLQSEQKIVEILTKNLPEHNIIAEEGNKMNKGSRYTWVIDPLDGTFSFAHNFPYFSISIGLLKDNLPVLGVLYHISSNDLYWAQEGKGAFVNGKKIQVSKVTDLTDTAGILDFGHIKKRSDKLKLYIEPLINKIGNAYAVGSAAASMFLVGKGIIDAYVCQAWVWDFTAGTVIVREAGGKVTDLEGNEPDWTKERLNIVASNGLVHNEILGVLKI